MLTISIVRTTLLALWATGPKERLRVRMSVAQEWAWVQLGIMVNTETLPAELATLIGDFAADVKRSTMSGYPILTDADIAENVIRFELPDQDYPIARIVNLAVPVMPRFETLGCMSGQPLGRGGA